MDLIIFSKQDFLQALTCAFNIVIGEKKKKEQKTLLNHENPHQTLYCFTHPFKEPLLCTS